jgi:hypothetical protein
LISILLALGLDASGFFAAVTFGALRACATTPLEIVFVELTGFYGK